MAKAIMIQGTMSNAGKSLLVTGLCRIFKQDGYRVAPFKSQNMALNSYITKDGLEMGRAQAVQAEAAGKEPDVRMNPILLKPTSDRGSQVIVNGKVLGNQLAADYFKMKSSLKPEIKKAYDSLADENDIIVIEGAGSPAEINLLQDDIVNMGIARMVQAPVLIVGDIDRGGVFASLYGTVKLLDEDARYIKGVIINKFRGDEEILKPGLQMLEDLIHLPVLGVVPYMQVDIEDEDSLSERFSRSKKDGLLDVAVIRLPRISNFTDFNALSASDAFSVRYVESPEAFGNPDFVILPGTKNTIEDLKWLKKTSLASEIIEYAKEGHPLFGICGGYQMLGHTIQDPFGVEAGGSIAGLGLLPVYTVLGKEKICTQVRGHFKAIGGILEPLSQVAFQGYEIHMGVTTAPDSASISWLETGSGVQKEDGASNKANVYGSYVHGIFDSAQVVQTLFRCLSSDTEPASVLKSSVNFHDYKEHQYDLLADTLRKSLDMPEIYRILR